MIDQHIKIFTSENIIEVYLPLIEHKIIGIGHNNFHY